jgi:hypothetical protein
MTAFYFFTFFYNLILKVFIRSLSFNSHPLKLVSKFIFCLNICKKMEEHAMSVVRGELL